MHFTRAQLRTLRDSFEAEQPIPELPKPDPYGVDRAKVTLLTVLTTESGIINLSTFPRTDSEGEPLDIVRKRITDITGANNEQMQPENFRKVVANAPTDLVAYDEQADLVKLTERGEASLALGGLLLQRISLKRQQRIRDWVGGRLIVGKQRVSTVSTPQLHRVHILGSLLPDGKLLTALQLADESDGNLGYRNALGIVERMYEAGILAKVRVKRSPPKFAWRIVPDRRATARALLGTIDQFDPENRDHIEEGLEVMDKILADGNGGLARVLHLRGVLSSGSGSRPEPTSFNDRLGALFRELPPDTVLSASQIGKYLGETVTLERLRRQVGKPGCTFPLECLEIPHPSGNWYRFRPRRLDYAQS